MRLAKYIAAAGICSRREAERLIFAGDVSLNGEVINSPAVNVRADDHIIVAGKRVKADKKIRLWLYNKPVGLVTTHKDEQGRKTVFSTLNNLPRVISVGRLDINSEGLLLLTNSGELASFLENPRNKFDRVYKVRAFGNISDIISKRDHKNAISCKIADFTYHIKKLIKIGKNQNMVKNTNHWFEVTLQEGRNREIRKVFQHFNMQVNRLIRVSYAGLQLGDLPLGKWQEVDVPSNIMNALTIKEQYVKTSMR